MRKRIATSGTLLTSCLLFGSLLAILILPVGILLNADLILPVNMLVDLRNGLNIGEWNGSPNNFYIPEIGYYLGIGTVFSRISPIFLHMLYPILSGTLLGLTTYYLHSTVLSSRDIGTWTRNLLPVFPVALSLVNQISGENIIYVAVLPEIHFGAYLACLVGITLASVALTGKTASHRKSSLAWLMMVCLLAALSDNFFILWFTIPFLATLAHMLFGSEAFPKQRIKGVFGAVLLSSLAGYILHKITNSATSSNKVSLENIALSLTRLSNVLSNERYITVYALIALILSISLYFTSLQQASTHDFTSQDASISLRRKIFWIWNFYSIPATLILVILYGLVVDAGSTRYFLPLFFAPITAGIWIITELLFHNFSLERFRTARNSTFTAIYISVFAIVLAALPGYLSSYKQDPGYQLTQCLKSENVGVWYSEYWNSKPVHAFSNGSIISRQILNDGTPYRFNNNNMWYKQEPASSESKVAIMLDTDFARNIPESIPLQSCGKIDFKIVPKKYIFQQH